jgi:hypothetical protein
MRNWRKVAGISLKATLPLLTIGVAAGAAYWLIATQPKPPHNEVSESAPAISAVRLERRTVCFPIRSQGTVQPRRETTSDRTCIRPDRMGCRMLRRERVLSER